MKVFLSWSGEQSRQAAEAFSDWIQCVIQACKPWISTRDIDRGSIWFAEINEQLKDVSVGVIFLTNENKNKPWILFEAGALAKGLTNSRVCTFLIDLTPGDIFDPLAQFNHTTPDKQGVYALVRTLNISMPFPLDDKVLDRIFDTYWPQFEERLRMIRDGFVVQNGGVENAAGDSEVLKEILSSTRSISNRIARLENIERDRNESKTSLRRDSRANSRRYNSSLISRVNDFINDAKKNNVSAEEFNETVRSFFPDLPNNDVLDITNSYIIDTLWMPS